MKPSMILPAVKAEALARLCDHGAIQQQDNQVVRLAQLNLDPVLAGSASGLKAGGREQILVDRGCGVGGGEPAGAGRDHVDLRAGQVPEIGPIVGRGAALAIRSKPNAVRRRGRWRSPVNLRAQVINAEDAKLSAAGRGGAARIPGIVNPEIELQCKVAADDCPWGKCSRLR